MRNFDLTLIWLGFFAAVFLAWYFYLKARNKERMALIEGGKDVSEIFSRQEIKFRFPWLKLGMLFTGVGFGLGLVMLFAAIYPGFRGSINGNQTGPFLIIASMMLFGGLGVVIGYYLDKPKN